MEENKLNFDLQLFAEGDAPAEPTADNTVGVEQLLETGDSAETDTPEQANDNYDWKIDENGNVTFSDNMFADQNMYSPDGEQTEKVEGQEETKDEPQEPNPDLPPKPEFYDVVINGEPQKVTLEQLRQGYMLQSDYTRKTQQLAEERRAFEAAKGQFAQQNPQMQQQQQPVQETKPNPKEYYEQLSNYAIGRVKQNLGEDFDEYNPIHQAALADEIATVKAEMYQRNQAQLGMQRVQQKYSQDPNYREIDNLATQLLQQLPYKQAVQIQEALRNNNADIIDEYMGAVRDQYYRSRGYIPESEAKAQQQQQQAVQSTPKVVPQKVTPPHVESTGTANDRPQGEVKIDYSKLGRLSMDQQAIIASKLLNV